MHLPGVNWLRRLSWTTGRFLYRRARAVYRLGKAVGREVSYWSSPARANAELRELAGIHQSLRQTRDLLATRMGRPAGGETDFDAIPRRIRLTAAVLAELRQLSKELEIALLTLVLDKRTPDRGLSPNAAREAGGNASCAPAGGSPEQARPDRHPAWTIVDERPVVSCPPVVTVSVQTVQLPDGRRVSDYYQLRMPDFVLVYAETAEGGVLMLRSYRHGPRRVCLSFPGGGVTDGESAEDAAKRELLEETGFESGEWQAIGRFLTNANQGGATAHFFRASNCRRVAPVRSSDLEDSEVLELSASELMAAMRAGSLASLSHAALLSIATHPARVECD